MVASSWVFYLSVYIYLKLKHVRVYVANLNVKIFFVCNRDRVTNLFGCSKLQMHSTSL
jgi:hypothetical protein